MPQSGGAGFCLLGAVEAAPQIPPQLIAVQLTSADSFKLARCPVPDLESRTEKDNAPLKLPAQAPFDINVPVSQTIGIYIQTSSVPNCDHFPSPQMSNPSSDLAALY